MKLRTLRSAVLALVAVGALALVACKSSETPAPAGEPAAAQPAAAQPAAGEPAAAATEAAPPKTEEAKPVEPKAEPTKTEAPAAPAPAAGDIPAPEDVAAVPADAAKTASGLASKVLVAGTGDAHPGAEDTVTVHYTGWTTDGKMFDSSVKRGSPSSFPLDRVIPGWTEGMQLMVKGEKRRFWIPANLAYGETPSRPGAPAGMLVFDVELIDIQVAPKIEVPADVAAPPADAKKTASGLAYKEIAPGTRQERPGPTDVVEVHYSGWTTDGKMFDSSVKRGSPATFPLNRVIPGWTEGLQLMTVGQKMRFWIPGNLAYGDTPSRPGAPAGMLVFDVELRGIK